jgi:hypothetical protein
MRNLLRGAGRRHHPEGNPDPAEIPAEDGGTAQSPPEAATYESPAQPGKSLRDYLRAYTWIPRPDPRWNQRTVTVSLEKEQVHVVVFRGRRVIAWGSSTLTRGSAAAPENDAAEPWDPTHNLRATLDGLGIKPAGRWWKAAEMIGVRRGRVVMDLFLYSTLMRHLQIPRVRLRYLEPVVLSEVLESLPFSQDEVDINWRLQKGEEDQSSVFAIALPKEKIDQQVNLVREAGLIPAAAYSKASALALASGVSDGILVHRAAAETALVLVHQGDPKVIHQLEFDPRNPDPQECASSLVRAIEQVAGYHQAVASAARASGDAPGGSNQPAQDAALPVVLTGLSPHADPVVQALLPMLRRPVVSIEPPVRYPDDFPISQYATNVGLFLADRRSTSGRELEAPTATHNPLNLLPRRHQPRPLPALQAAVFITLILLAIHPINVTERLEAKVLERNAIAQQLQILRAEERSLDVILVSQRNNNRQLESVRSQTASLEARLEQLQKEADTVLARLFTITDDARPPGVEVSSVTPLGQGYTLSGGAGSHADALQYVSNLRSSPFFSEVRIVRLDGPGGANPENNSRIGFQIRLTPAAASDSAGGGS